jgi:DNA repair protein RadC
MTVPRCPGGQPPVVRLTLKKEHCVARGSSPIVKTPEAAVQFLNKFYGCEAQEWAVAIGVSNTAEVLGVLEVAVGGLSSTAVDPKVVFSGLLLMGATGFLFAHNHPSGDPEPSSYDVTLTRQLKAAADALTIRLVDHVIITGRGHTSMYQRGLI